MKNILNLFLLIIALGSCKNDNVKDESSGEIQAEPKYYAVKENIDILMLPSTSSKKLINEKASSITKETEYCGLDKSCKLVILEVKGKYSKIKVIEPNWLTDTYIGWVPTSILMEFGSIVPAKAVPSKIVAFNNVNGLIVSLSQNGLGNLGSWRSDDIGGFMSITEYYRFGAVSKVNGLENNLAYYLESGNETYVEKLTLVLNIFNSYERKSALSKFRITIEKTFKSLKLSPPPRLISSLGEPKAYSYTNKVFKVGLEREKNNIESWKFIIKSM